MSIRSNLHTHTVYCDGQNTPLEMVEAAMKKGFRSLGFSGHAYTPFESCCCMTPTGTLAYRAEILRLRERFAGRIELFLGLENDGAQPQPTEGYEFVIGSLHYLPGNGRHYPLDASPELLRACIDECFGGNALSLVEAYYEALLRYVRTGNMDIVGHFDLIQKFNAGNRIFNADAPAYRRLALEAAEEVAKSGKVIEINTGAMARGYTNVAYPAPFLIKRLLELRAPLTLSSDAHDAESIDSHFALMISILSDMGCKELMELRRGQGFVPVPLE